MFIQINLLPDARSGRRRKALKLPAKQLVTIAAAVVILAAVGIGAVVFLRGQGRREYAALTQEMQVLEPQRQHLAQLQKRWGKLGHRTSLLGSMEETRALWAGKLERLSAAVPGLLWLTELVVDDEGSVEIKGTALQQGEEGGAKAVGEFMKALRDDELFSSHYVEIELQSMQRRRIENVQVMDFALGAVPKKPGEGAEVVPVSSEGGV
ncbi:MAG: PilN domain-containing protein [Candidatus Omnitrophica bacterium]|nr:PilN domain-containing protein [Candidatus Omnitrophota bacterium]